jgi:hypothetical protein
MAIRFIVRPKGMLTTPTALKIATQAQALRLPIIGQRFDPSKDVFIALPETDRVEGLSEGQRASYHQLLGFYKSNKFRQRKLINDAGIKVPATVGITDVDATKPFVLRPMFHRAGSGFVLCDSLPTFSALTHYAAELFVRTHEYRVIYCHGQRICTLLKRMPEGMSQERPWTHQEGAFFVELSTPLETHRLTSRGCYAVLESFHVVQQAHLCAVDVMVNADSYAVSEINFAPALTVPSRIERVAARLLEYRNDSSVRTPA